ncbi:MAG: hypothetical protein WA821_11955 [Anaerolineales bacterium]
MPKLLLFAPCQKILVDKLENSISLINVMHGLAAGRVENTSLEPMSPDTKIPLQWAIGTLWLRSSDDGEKTFEQRTEMIIPDNTRMEINVQSFVMTHRTHQIAMRAGAFPVGLPGEYKLVLSLREVGTNDEWQELAEYPIELTHETNLTKKVDD